MTRKSVSFRGVLCALSILSLSTPMMAATASSPGAPPPLEGVLPIATGAASNVDGYLEVVPDDYGSWASAGFGGGGDTFNPAGPSAPAEVGFTSGFYLFVPGLGQRELLTDNQTWQDVLGADGSLSKTITSPGVPSDTSGDGVNDTLNSSFSVSGGATSLSFDLTQSVSADTPGVAILDQTYVITNDANGTASFSLVRAFDADLVWGGGTTFADDEVGTTMHGAGLGPYVFQQEFDDPGVTAITMSGAGNNYYGGKNGVEPGNGPPPYGFGTDVQVWEAFGIPTSWESHIAGVGYFKNGVSGASPPGAAPTPDGFIGLGFPVLLGAGENITITVFHTFGANTPGGGPPPPVPAASYQGAIALVLLLTTSMAILLLWRRRSTA